MTDMEKLTAFMKRVNPLLHEPLATTVAEEWGAKFVQEFPVFGKALTPTDDEQEAITDEALWDFAGDLLDAWNIEDLNPPGLIEQFRDRFVARFGYGSPQGEPSDAQVRAAMNEFYGRKAQYLSASRFEAMRAALRAAGGVR